MPYFPIFFFKKIKNFAYAFDSMMLQSQTSFPIDLPKKASANLVRVGIFALRCTERVFYFSLNLNMSYMFYNQISIN